MFVTDSKMQDHLNNYVVKARNRYELCLLQSHTQKSFHNNIPYFPLEYPFTNIAFQLAIPKHLPMLYDQQVTKFESNFTLLSQSVPNKVVKPVAPILPSSLYIQGVQLMTSPFYTEITPLSQEQALSVDKISQESLLDQNLEKHMSKKYSNIDAPQLSKYLIPITESESVNKKTNINTSVPSSNQLLTNMQKPSSINIHCQKQKCKVEPTLRQSNAFENHLASSFNPIQLSVNQSLRSRCQNSIVFKQNVKSDIDDNNLFDFSIEAEQMVSSICNSSPPNVSTEKDMFHSKHYDTEIFKNDQSEFEMKSFNEKPQVNEFLKAINKTLSITHTMQTDSNEDWSKNATKHNMCKIFPNNEPNVRNIFNNQFPHQNENLENLFSFEKLTKKMSSTINQETLLFREAAIRGCYDIDNILKSTKPKCPEIEVECNSVKNSIFSAISEVRDFNIFLSDFCLSFLQIIKSWIGFNSHIENSTVNNLLQNIDPLLPEYFKNWQYITRIFMDRMVKCLQIVNDSNLLNSSDVANSTNFKTKSVPQNNSSPNAGQQDLNNLNLLIPSHSTLTQTMDEQIISDAKTNLNFFVTKQEIKIPETNDFFKEMHLKSETIKNVNPQKNWKQRRFSDTNSAFGNVPKSNFCPLKTNMSPVSQIQANWTPSTLKYSSPFTPEKNETLLVGCGDGVYKSNIQNINKDVTNLVGPSFSSKKMDSCFSSNQSVSGDNFSNTPSSNFKIPLFNTFSPGPGLYENHSGYVKDHNNVLMNGLTPCTTNTIKFNQQHPFTPLTPPYYIPALGIIGTPQPLINSNKLVNPIQCVDSDSDSNTTYMRPGCYNPPQKTGGCTKPMNSIFPLEDIPVIGIPFIYSNELNKSQSMAIQQPPNIHESNTDILELTSNKSDDTWKAALESAESLCETLMMKPISENEYNPTNIFRNCAKTTFTTNNSNIELGNTDDIDSDDDEEFELQHSLSLSTTESRFKTDDWLINSFNQAMLKSEDTKLDNSLIDDDKSEKNELFIKSSKNIERNSDTNKSFIELKKIDSKDLELFNSNFTQDMEKYKSGAEPDTTSVCSLKDMIKENKHNILSSSNPVNQLNIYRKDDDCTTYLTHKLNKTGFGWCGTKPRRSINRQTCRKLQDILDTLWKTDILKLFRNINNSKQVILFTGTMVYFFICKINMYTYSKCEG